MLLHTPPLLHIPVHLRPQNLISCTELARLYRRYRPLQTAAIPVGPRHQPSEFCCLAKRSIAVDLDQTGIKSEIIPSNGSETPQTTRQFQVKANTAHPSRPDWVTI